MNEDALSRFQYTWHSYPTSTGQTLKIVQIHIPRNPVRCRLPALSPVRKKAYKTGAKGTAKTCVAGAAGAGFAGRGNRAR